MQDLRQYTGFNQDRKSKVDVATITDDELSAAIDEASGYIRFTLGKRRKDHDQDTQTMLEQPIEPVDGHKKADQNSESNVARSEATRQSDESCAIKRSRLTKSIEQSFNETSSPKLVRRYSEQPTQIVDISSSSSFADFGQWFSINLPGLIEYQSKFISNGIDSLSFMNHPQLINDDVLFSVGIDNESHRELIKETVKTDLPKVDFMSITEADKSTTVEKFLSKLQLIHLSAPNLVEISHNTLVDRNSCAILKRIATNWTLGHQLRLLTAIDAISTQLSFNDEVSKEDDDMVTSQTFSSSSSKESIKSIILVKNETIKHDDNADGVNNKITSIDDAREDSERHRADKPTQLNVRQTVEVKAKTEPAQLEEPQLPAQPVNIARSGMSGKPLSLVSQVARRLEEEKGLQLRGPMPFGPVAATRNLNKAKLANVSTLDASQNPSQPVSSLGDQKPNTEIKILSQIEKASIDEQNKKSTGHSIWPPNDTNQKSTVTSDPVTSRPVRKLDAIRMTFEKQIEESSRNQSYRSGDRGLRPKPPPPVKPAKLMQVSNKPSDTGAKA